VFAVMMMRLSEPPHEKDFSLATATSELECPVCALAGVLLGKTSLNSLYGQKAVLRRIVLQFWSRRFGPRSRICVTQINKIVFF
jgi:hypothetical protein